MKAIFKTRSYWHRLPPSQRKRSFLARLSVLGGRFPAVRFAVILGLCVAGIFCGCYFQHALTISPALSFSDVKNPRYLLTELGYGTNQLSTYIRHSFSQQLQSNLVSYVDAYPGLTKQTVKEINQIIQTNILYESNRFATVKLTRGTKLLLARPTRDYKLVRVNRLLLNEAYPKALRNKPVGLLEDWVMLTLLIVLLIGVVTIRRLVAKVEDLLEQLPDMLKPEARIRSARLREDLRRIRNTIALRTPAGRRWWYALLVLCATLILIFQVVFPFRHLIAPTWSVLPMEYPISFVVGCIWAYFWFFTVGGSMLWYVLATGFAVFPRIKRFADRNELWIVPNAPDGQGGLSPIGAVAFGMSSVLGSGMAMVAVWTLLYGPDPALLIGGGIYSLAVTAALFLPLWSTHDAMRRAKQEELKRVAGLFRAEYELLPTHGQVTSVQGGLESDTELKSRLDLMTKLETIYGTVKSMPVWPFDVATIRKFGFLIATPIMSAIVHQLWGPSLSKAVEAILGGFR